MGGKEKHDRCMGMHGEAWEARESMIDAWACMGGKEKHDRCMACMGGKGKHDRRMGMHGEALESEDIELPSVLIVGAEGLEVFGSHAEHEIVSEDRVVVLEDGGNLSLGLAFQVKAD